LFSADQARQTLAAASPEGPARGIFGHERTWYSDGTVNNKTTSDKRVNLLLVDAPGCSRPLFGQFIFG